jgi:hypothetical protein
VAGETFALRYRHVAEVIAGCPSFGGQRTAGSCSTATVGARSLRCSVLMRSKPSRSVASARQVGSLAHQPVASSLPNPAFKRTCLRQAA